MGFCRRCGDIVVGPRCKCGGTSVAPVVKWNQDDGKPAQDPWSKTYVTREKAAPKPIPRTNTGQGSVPPSSSVSTSTKRFPRPESQKPASVSLDRRVSAHIASSTSVVRPPSPLKHSTSASEDDDLHSTPNPEEGILPNLNNGSRLAKVYGSVLQPKETLSTFICALCSAPFPPDATIYPDPTSIRPGLPIDDVGSGTRFLCRPCFTANGGSKGDCPACLKPVLILKSEGGFVETSGKVWHKRCFCCEGCFKNIGDHPMVDLLGRPSCADCFESCLRRPSGNTPRRRVDSEEGSNLGGIKRTNREREGSPALEELEARLGIRSRDNTPAAESRGARFLNNSSSPSAHTLTSPPPSTRSPASKRYSTILAGDASPTAERLAARARANSSSSVGSPSIVDALARYQGSDASPSRNGSPLSRRSYSRLRSPDLDGGDASPLTARLTGSGSPRYGSPISSKPPTADAIEEMKQRFLRQASPGLPSAPAQSTTASSSTTTTPTRPARRSRSRPRSSGTPSSMIGDDGLPEPLQPQLTSGTVAPLRIARRDNTGGASQVGRDDTGGANHVRRDHTGGTSYVQRDDTGGASRVRRDETGGSSYVRRDNTGGANHVRRDNTGGTGRLRRDTTGNSAYVRGDTTGNSEYTLKADRTGNAEVESLLGSFPTVPTGDLIDLGPDTSISSFSSSLSGGSLSRIHRPIQSPSSPHSGHIGLGLNFDLRKSVSGTSLATDYTSSVPPTPDLAGDFSDAATQSSGPSTPPSLSPPSRRGHAEAEKARSPNGKADATTPTPKSRTLPHDITIPTPLPTDERCARCNLPLFSKKDGGKFVTVPEQPSSSGMPPKTYHASCFRCTVCDRLFQDSEGGRAVFVRSPKGACHVECAPPERTVVRTYTATMPKPAPTAQFPPRTATATYHPASSSRYEPPPKTAPASQQTFTFPQPRFGSSSACPGCHISVSPMERGVVPGPQGSRWHSTCLVCGGKEAKGRRREPGKPGCGKKLDSAAKTDRDGSVWCRECLLLMPAAHRGSPSPTRTTPIAPTHTGGKHTFGGVAPQSTGTTLARQFTGLGSSDPALMRQLTGGGLSPTRQLTSSPTKMFDGPRPGVSRYPRPKSAIGFAARTKSEGGESRGMFLVRQLTGGRNKEVA
ncbi:hypothetical protein BD413DRAFT_98031 [Trametes elegans]|nr:hypothetical protein BD413DRAFT_98031 [Trametes elegans]